MITANETRHKARSLQSRGIIGTIDFKGTTPQLAHDLLTGIEAVADLLPNGFRHHPVNIKTETFDALTRSVAAHYVAARASITVVVPPLRAEGPEAEEFANTFANCDWRLAGIHESTHHLQAQLTPRATRFLYHQLELQTDVAGISQPQTSEQAREVIAASGLREYAATNARELGAVIVEAVVDRQLQSSRRPRRLISCYWSLFQAMFGSDDTKHAEIKDLLAGDYLTAPQLQTEFEIETASSGTLLIRYNGADAVSLFSGPHSMQPRPHIDNCTIETTHGTLYRFAANQAYDVGNDRLIQTLADVYAAVGEPLIFVDTVSADWDCSPVKTITFVAHHRINAHDPPFYEVAALDS